METRWAITVDNLDHAKLGESLGGGGAVGKKTKEMTIAIRLYDDDDELYYSGWMTQELMDSEDCFAPLDWAMFNAGCTSMQYKEPGKEWATL